MIGKLSWKVGSCGMIAWILSCVLAWASASTTTGTLSAERDGNGNQFYKVSCPPHGESLFYASDIAQTAKGQMNLAIWAKDHATVTVTIKNGLVIDITKVGTPK